MVLIFVEEVSERLQFTLDFVFSERKIAYQLTNDEQFFENANQPKFNYSNINYSNCAALKPAAILFDVEIINYEIDKGQFGNQPCLSFNAVIDPLASIFYILSRMEEYVVVNKDSHDRFPAKSSILYQYGWLQNAMCDRWAEAILDFKIGRASCRERV